MAEQLRAGDRVRYRRVDHPTVAVVDAVIWSHGPADGTWWVIPQQQVIPRLLLVQGCFLAHRDGIALLARHGPEAAP